MVVITNIDIDKAELIVVQNELRGRVLDCKLKEQTKSGYVKFIRFVGSQVGSVFKGEYQFEEAVSDVPGDLSFEEFPGMGSYEDDSEVGETEDGDNTYVSS